MPISPKEIVDGSILRQIAEYPLLTTINKVTQNVYQINDKLLIIKELNGEHGEYEVEFDSEEFKPFYSNNDFYIALTYKSWGRGGFLLTPKDVKRLLNLDEEDDKTQLLTIKSVDSGGFEVSNVTTRKKLSRRIEQDDFPRNFFGNVPFEDEFGWLDEDEFDWLTDNEEDESIDVSESIERIKSAAITEGYEILQFGQQRFQIYTPTVHGIDFEVRVVANYIQIHLYEKISEKYGKCVYSLRTNAGVDSFCDILRISKRIQAKTKK
jgi:hypothetical protein